MAQNQDSWMKSLAKNQARPILTTPSLQESRICDNLILANGPVRSENKCPEKGIRVRKPNTN